VARHTDPGWIAVFANAAGVIAERGSLLSHSAIVAREMGVPCVVSLKGVTQWLKTGDVVRLDGGAGTVGLQQTNRMNHGRRRYSRNAPSSTSSGYAQALGRCGHTRCRTPPESGDTVVSIASAGDNALALLAEGPERVIAVDLNPVQLACVRMRVAMYRVLSHEHFLELMGSRPSGRRRHLLDQVAVTLTLEDQAFWAGLKDEVAKYGVGGVGKFERVSARFANGCCPSFTTRGRSTIY